MPHNWIPKVIGIIVGWTVAMLINGAICVWALNVLFNVGLSFTITPIVAAGLLCSAIKPSVRVTK